MTSPTNSSATYVFARTIKENKLATLVGQTTGGNQKGITASSLFFMALPHSKIEVDVPLVGVDYNEAKTRPDAGLMPDVSVKPLIEDVFKGIDADMEAVKGLILKGGKK
jgi:C-terminal processing protease CtpA/Prc